MSIFGSGALGLHRIEGGARRNVVDVWNALQVGD
jgi:hypothetical protein